MVFAAFGDAVSVCTRRADFPRAHADGQGPSHDGRGAHGPHTAGRREIFEPAVWHAGAHQTVASVRLTLCARCLFAGNQFPRGLFAGDDRLNWREDVHKDGLEGQSDVRVGRPPGERRQPARRVDCDEGSQRAGCCPAHPQPCTAVVTFTVADHISPAISRNVIEAIPGQEGPEGADTASASGTPLVPSYLIPWLLVSVTLRRRWTSRGSPIGCTFRLAIHQPPVPRSAPS